MAETFTEAYPRLFEAVIDARATCKHATWRVLWGMRHREQCADCGVVRVNERLGSF